MILFSLRLVLKLPRWGDFCETPWLFLRVADHLGTPAVFICSVLRDDDFWRPSLVGAGWGVQTP